MKKKSIALVMAGMMCTGLLGGCGGNGESQTSAGEGQTQAGAKATTAEALSNIYSGELERDVTIRVLENDTAIEQGYFQELIDAFNAKWV